MAESAPGGHSVNKRTGGGGHEGKSTLRRLLEWGGIAAGTIMVAFGIAAIVMGFDGRSTVQDSLANEFIVGSDDMTPEVINAEIPGIVAAQKEIAAARQQAGAEAIEFTPVRRPTAPSPARRSTTATMPMLRGVPPHPRPAVDERSYLRADGPFHGST